MIIDSESKKNDGVEHLATFLAKQEINVRNVDPIVAQKRELLTCKIAHLKNEIGKTKVNTKCIISIYYYIKL